MLHVRGKNASKALPACCAKAMMAALRIGCSMSLAGTVRLRCDCGGELCRRPVSLNSALPALCDRHWCTSCRRVFSGFNDLGSRSWCTGTCLKCRRAERASPEFVTPSVRPCFMQCLGCGERASICEEFAAPSDRVARSSGVRSS